MPADQSHLAEALETGQTSISARMPDMVKGAGFRARGNRTPGSRDGIAPLEDYDKIFDMSARAEGSLMTSVRASKADPQAALKKALNPGFAQEFGLFGMMQMMGGGGMASLVTQLNELLSTELGKNISLTSPLSSGLVPFDLVAPSRLIYPIYSPLRNKIPRVPGQSTSRRVKVITGVQGTSTPSGSNGPARITIPEFQSGSLAGTSWPMNLPPSGTQTGVDLNIPYKFMGLTEAISWLAQFSGQGFEDISALANLILLQEVMLGEEFQMMFGTGTAVPTPSAPTIALRTAGSNETAVPAAGGGNSYYIRITATNVFGETVMSNAGEAAVGTTATDVIDVTVALPRGAVQWNLYISAAATSSSPPATRTSYFLLNTTQGIGATKYTIQGPTLPSSGTNPPASGTTAGTNDFEGFESVLDGHAVTDAAVYPSGFQGGYINKAVGDTLNIGVVNTMLQQLWDGPGAYRADPAELICEGSDAQNLSTSLGAQSGNAGYRFFIDQTDVANVRVGAAVSEFVNPVTRLPVKILVHPWMPQGNAWALSYQLPQAFSNLANCWEMTMVQDYLSINWPVIDASFRYSLFLYGALVAGAPQYSGILSGLQRSSQTPYA